MARRASATTPTTYTLWANHEQSKIVHCVDMATGRSLCGLVTPKFGWYSAQKDQRRRGLCPKCEETFVALALDGQVELVSA